MAEVLSERSLGATPTWHVDYTRGVPLVINDPVTTGIVASVASELFGPDSIADTPQSMGADSFGRGTSSASPARTCASARTIRSTTALDSTCTPRRSTSTSRAIAVGSQLLAGVALAALAQAGGE